MYNRAIQALEQILLGKNHEIRLALSCVLAGGHLLLEDLPGMGKTTLSAALAKVLGLEYTRVQFTSDLLPGDLVGSAVFSSTTNEFIFHSGPIFTHLLLADEINRASPKTQSALLEAMEESQVSVDGRTYPLPDPFFVIATQNASHQTGTYELPESQLDRFTMRLTLGYPPLEAEKLLLSRGGQRHRMLNLEPVFSLQSVQKTQTLIQSVHVGDKVIDYVLQLGAVSRHQEHFKQGLSPRALIAILSVAKSWAWMSERDYVIPEDVQAVFLSVVSHRLYWADISKQSGISEANWLLKQVSVLK